MIRVFLSSTAVDLAACRQEVYEAIEGLDGYHCVRMEDFGARSMPPSDFCIHSVAACDVYVILVGHLYGSIAPSDMSYTESEYEAARRNVKECLIFMVAKTFPLPATLSESNEKQLRQEDFRKRLSEQHIVKEFTDCGHLAAYVVQSLINCGTNKSALRLRQIAPEEEAQWRAFREPLVSIGRSPYSSIVLQDADVSWEHGHFIRMQGGYCYRHLSQTNASVLRRRGMQKLLRPGEGEEVAIQSQDRLTIGVTTFVVESDLVGEGHGYTTTKKR